MLKLCLRGTVVVLFLLASLLPTLALATPLGTQTLLIKFQEGTTAEIRSGVITALGGTLDRWFAPIHTAQVTVTPDLLTGIDKIIQRALTAPSVRSVELDGTVIGYGEPSEGKAVNDPAFNDPSLVYAPQLIGVSHAWLQTMGKESVLLAVVDSGVNAQHPDLQGRVHAGYDFVNEDADAADDHGHGTHIAGILAANANNNIGIAGVCPQCTILPVKVLNRQNSGTWADVTAGVLYAVDAGAQVINLSLGGYNDTQVMRDAVAYATSKGVLVVAAAGNGKTDAPNYPAAIPQVLSVAATRSDDTRWSLSNYGEWVDIAAPGYTIFSTHSDLNNDRQGYAYMTGTSMATPHVAGLAGLLLSQNPAWSPDDLIQIITSTAKDLGQAGKDVEFGFGRVDVGAALAVHAPAPVASSYLAGWIWQDDNANGQWDSHEVPVTTGYTVQVSSSEGTWTIEPDPQGSWITPNLSAGSYIVQLQGIEGTASAASHYTQQSYKIELAVGEQRDNLNFGLRPFSQPALQHQIYVPVVQGS